MSGKNAWLPFSYPGIGIEKINYKNPLSFRESFGITFY